MLSLDSAYEREDCGAGDVAEESPRRSNCGDVYGACAASSSAAYSGYGIGVREEEPADRGTGVRSASRDDELAAGGDGGGERGLWSSAPRPVGGAESGSGSGTRPFQSQSIRCSASFLRSRAQVSRFSRSAPHRTRTR